MNIEHLKQSDFQKSLWSGGSTTQLYISPKDASLAERNFDIRISTANVELEESTFTSLPGVSRKLMILDGEIQINHQNQYSKRLKQMDVDTFRGDWNTTAIGTCTDFNVMTTGNLFSELIGMEFTKDSNSTIHIEKEWNSLFLFIISGKLQLEIDGLQYNLCPGELIVIEKLSGLTLPILAKRSCQIAIVKIG